MTATELLETLKSSGVTLSVTSVGKLHVSASAFVITPAMREAIRARKTAILALISTELHPYALDELLATGKSRLGCARGHAHPGQWVWDEAGGYDGAGAYVCIACVFSSAQRRGAGR